MSFVSRTIAAQVTDHLRSDLQHGRWKDVLPGRDQIAAELGVNPKTVETALRQLEKERLLINPGKGSRRRISTGAAKASSSLRIAVLLSEMNDGSLSYIVDIRHRLRMAGHVCFEAEKSLVDLAMNPRRISALVSRTQADAWIVTAGSFDVLEWFAGHAKPAFALFGPMRDLPLAGTAPDKNAAMTEATRALLRLGHRRIATLARPRRRLPIPGGPEQAFLDELIAHGIPPADYHLPDWDENPRSFHAMLDAMFRVTPPTALIVDEAVFFVAVMQFCLARRIRVPEDLSLVCTDNDPTFAWCHRSVAHIAWDSRLVARRVLKWAENISRGRSDRRQIFLPAKFVPGGTVAAAPARLRGMGRNKTPEPKN